MNREMRRASQKEGERLMKLPWNKFEDITEQAYQKSMALNGNPNYRPDRVYMNNKYIVQVFEDNRQYFGVMFDKYFIRRNDHKPIYSWQDMQRIKNELIGPEREAIQLFPKESELVDVANIYWMFVESGFSK